MRTRTALLPLGLLVLVLVAPQAAADPPRELLKAQLEAARKVYEGYGLLMKSGQATLSVETLSHWSRRILQVQKALANNKEGRMDALKAHLQRMAQLEKVASAFTRAGQGRQADAEAARFFRLEAEVWIVEEKARK